MGVAISVAAASRPAWAKDRPQSKASRYFDVHTHVGPLWNATEPLSARTLLEWMDRSDIAQACVLPLVSPEASSYPISTDLVLDVTRPHRDRLIPFCAVDPRATFTGGRRALLDMVRHFVDAGAKGFGEHKPGVKIDDPRNMALYAACAEVKIPVLFHLDNERNMDVPGLPGLKRVLTEFPTVNFIGHGPGWWASISSKLTQADLGGYPEGPVVPGGAIDTLMDAHKNLYGDLSAGSGAVALKRDLAFAKAFMRRRADRLLFGTDYLQPGQDIPQLTLLRLLDLPREVEHKIFLANARQLLNVEG